MVRNVAKSQTPLPQSHQIKPEITKPRPLQQAIQTTISTKMVKQNLEIING